MYLIIVLVTFHSGPVSDEAQNEKLVSKRQALTH